LQERLLSGNKQAGKPCRVWLTSNSVARNKIPLASETNQGFMFGNKKLNWTRLALVIGNEEA
jgi:hypothetical protein